MTHPTPNDGRAPSPSEALSAELKAYVNDLALWREDDSEAAHEAAWQSAIMTIDRLTALATSSAASATAAETRVSEAATAARFARLYGIVRRIRWSEYGIAHTAAGTDSAAAMGELCEFLFADGVDAAIARDPSLVATPAAATGADEAVARTLELIADNAEAVAGSTNDPEHLRAALRTTAATLREVIGKGGV